MPPRTRLDERRQLAADLVGDVEQRAERARREERVARAPEQASLVAAERAQQRGLADACLAADEHELAAGSFADAGEARAEERQLARALEKHRSRYVGIAGGWLAS